MRNVTGTDQVIFADFIDEIPYGRDVYVLQMTKTEFVPKVTTVVASCSVVFIAISLFDRLLTMRTLASTGYLDALVNIYNYSPL